MTLEVFTLRERPDLRPLVFAAEFQQPLYPEYMQHDAAARLYFRSPFFDRYLDFAFAGVEHGKVVARAFSVPFALGAERTELPDGGWDEVIRWAHEDQALGRKPNAVSALEIALMPQARGAGHSRRMLDAMKSNARARGFADLFAPVRPTEKHKRPFMPMAEYVNELRADGLPVDAWLRTHVRVGGKIVKIAPYAMTIVGTTADWSRWTGMTFARSGPVAVPGALVPVYVSLEHDFGVYVEPGVWVRHAL
jgi:GNAT superfamily N-acetyltransferase